MSDLIYLNIVVLLFVSDADKSHGVAEIRTYSDNWLELLIDGVLDHSYHFNSEGLESTGRI